jgi:TolB-like protein/Tfp pilus assembly protein PilF
MPLIAELRRRNVFRVAAAYLVVGWLLTEVLTTILPTLGAPNWAARAVILTFAFGFIPAVVLSWVFELTPDGIKREHEVDRSDSVTGKTGRKLDYVTIVGVILAVVFFGFFSAKTSDDEPPIVIASNASVAVLPFVNMSGDKDNEYFSDGLTETLLHMLAQVPDLKVAARTSSFAFKDQNTSIQDIAEALGVAHVLEGSVQRVGDRVRITAQLIRAADGFHVWSSSYDRTLDDIFGIQDEIAEKVGTSLSTSLLGKPKDEMFAGVTTANSDAYDLYLQARRERATFSYGGLQAAERLLKGALTIDPDFMDAKSELAVNYIHQVETGLMEGESTFPEIIAIADQVLEVRPDDAVAQAVQIYGEAMIRAYDGEITAIAGTQTALEEIVADAPGVLYPRILLARAYRNGQERDNALVVLQDALENDPFNPQIYYELGTLNIALRNWDDARASLEKSLEIEPAQPNAYVSLADIARHEGDAVTYVQYALKAIEVDPSDHELHGLLAGFLYQLDLVEEGDDFRDRVMAIAPTSEVTYRLNLLRAISLEDVDASIAAARSAIENDVENRRFAYGGAVQYLLWLAARSGTYEQEAAFLEENVPGILDVYAESLSPKYKIAQFVALDAWYASLPRDEVMRRLDTLVEFAIENGFDEERQPTAHMGMLALRGEVQEAIKIGLSDVFVGSVAERLNWRETFSQSYFEDVVADPQVQAAFKRWEEEEEALRGQVQTYLADIHAST